MFNIWEHDEISYREQADNLFNLPAWQQGKTESQQIIPFVGAGVSISARPVSKNPRLIVQPPEDAEIDKCCSSLGLEGNSAKLFMRMAIFLALSLEAAEKDLSNFSDDSLLDSLQHDASPPSARQLARLFANLSTYTTFKQVVNNLSGLFPEGFINASERQQIAMMKLVARITRIADPPDPLTSITSYYENKNGRGSLWTKLSLVMSSVGREPTLTHKLMAAAAKRHLEQSDVWDDFLILTTNYDCLMEDALDRAGVDYVVLTTRKSDHKVLVRFSDSVKDSTRFTEMNSGLTYPGNFHLKRKRGHLLAIVCKLHGCLNPRLSEKDDGLVISDSDYVDYISQINTVHGTIPSEVTTLMQDKPFLFLGYSFNDWNVRSVFELTRRKRVESFRDQDYAVTSYIGEYEQQFFKKNGVAILKTDLNSFAQGVMSAVQTLKDMNLERWGPLVDGILSSLAQTSNQSTANVGT